MKKLNKEIGNFGEKLAVDILKEKKHIILEQNYRSKLGEIDIISLIIPDILVCTEVKTRYSNKFGLPLESITKKKIANLIKTINYYLFKNSISTYYIRFDVIEIYLNTDNTTYNFNHIEDAFRT
ncbi:MAG: YraN family protein [Sarcina sp.]